jgi:hypothetical protein
MMAEPSIIYFFNLRHEEFGFEAESWSVEEKKPYFRPLQFTT